MYDDMNLSTVTRHSRVTVHGCPCTMTEVIVHGQCLRSHTTSTSQITVSDCQYNVKMGSKLDIIFYINFSKRVAGIYCFPGSPLGCALEKIE